MRRKLPEFVARSLEEIQTYVQRSMQQRVEIGIPRVKDPIASFFPDEPGKSSN